MNSGEVFREKIGKSNSGIFGEFLLVEILEDAFQVC